MAKGKNVHVTKRDEGWAVKTAGSERAVKIHDTQAEAAEHAKRIAINNKSEVLIHGRDGKNGRLTLDIKIT